jgi:hypothetical protein
MINKSDKAPTLANKKTNESKNALKQKRFRERQKLNGKRLIRGYVTSDAQDCYNNIREKTGWTDSEVLNNSLRITYAAYKCGQIKLLNEWLKENNL